MKNLKSRKCIYKTKEGKACTGKYAKTVRRKSMCMSHLRIHGPRLGHTFREQTEPKTPPSNGIEPGKKKAKITQIKKAPKPEKRMGIDVQTMEPEELALIGKAVFERLYEWIIESKEQIESQNSALSSVRAITEVELELLQNELKSKTQRLESLGIILSKQA